MTKQEQIKSKIEELKGQMNDLSVGFVVEYKNESLVGVDDAFYSFAENEVSYFEDDQIEYYFNNERSCLDGIECYYGDFKAFASTCKTPRECICSAGVYGWQYDNVSILESDKEAIIAILYLYNLIEFKEVESLNDEDFEHFLASLDDVKAFDFYDFEHCDTFMELAELLGFELC